MKGLKLLFLLTSTWVSAQEIKGKLLDQSRLPVSGAMVFIAGDSSRFSVSDSTGAFRLTEVQEGRLVLTIQKAGYVQVAEEILVTLGKSLNLEFILQESNILLQSLSVSAGRTPAAPGTYGITIEKTLRLPANFFDPLRLVSVLPAVSNGNDQANGISFRGYSPNGLLWRLEGMDIVNPNHLANAGTLSDRPVANGGGVSILSAQVLDKSEFHYGILPASAGNALSGVMDMSLRKGNSESEYTVQAGLIGTDLAAEGKLGKSGRTTWLVNGRYSTVGLLSKAGLDFGGESIDFSDITFHVQSDHKTGGGLSVFGFSGISRNEFRSKEIISWESEKDRYNISYRGRTTGVGLKDSRVLNHNLSAEFGITWSSQEQSRTSESLPFTRPHVVSEQFNASRQLLSGMVKLRANLGSSLRAETGAVITWSNQSFSSSAVSSLSSPILPDRFAPIDGTISGALVQPYANLQAGVGLLRVNAGLRWMHFSWNGTSSVEPRLSATLQAAGGLFTIGYGITSQLQQIQVYLTDNNKLPMTQSAQWYAEYARSVKGGIQWRVSAFRHRLTGVPLRQYPSTSPNLMPVSAVNFLEETGVPSMNGDGTGRNVGLEGMVEKRFDRQWYMLASGSIIDATYGIQDVDADYQSRFNSRYTWAIAGGKEWQRTQNAFGIHVKAIGFGGQRERVIDAAQSEQFGTTMWDVTKGYDVRLPDYFRTDLRLAWRKNRPGRTRTLSIDIQNLMNARNIGGYYFDTLAGKVATRYQLGIIPVLTWRLDF